MSDRGKSNIPPAIDPRSIGKEDDQSVPAEHSTNEQLADMLDRWADKCKATPLYERADRLGYEHGITLLEEAARRLR